MQISMRTSLLKASLGQAAGAPVRVTKGKAGRVRLSTAAPADTSSTQWTEVLEILRSGCEWGSTDATGEVIVWVELEDFNMIDVGAWS
ncbi:MULTISPECIES: hypothetical protein [Streptomyces]|uniref:hypothetical protein n=1 Tax=Streptomyces TaxID=1883 RepID=UPI0004AB04CB|nr:MULTISPECIES: hypothetical protein [Streptomyces]